MKTDEGIADVRGGGAGEFGGSPLRFRSLRHACPGARPFNVGSSQPPFKSQFDMSQLYIDFMLMANCDPNLCTGDETAQANMQPKPL